MLSNSMNSLPRSIREPSTPLSSHTIAFARANHTHSGAVEPAHHTFGFTGPMGLLLQSQNHLRFKTWT